MMHPDPAPTTEDDVIIAALDAAPALERPVSADEEALVAEATAEVAAGAALVGPREPKRATVPLVNIRATQAAWTGASWRIAWAPAALRDFCALPDATSAASIDEVLQRFARSEGGDLRKVQTATGIEYYLLAPAFRVRFSCERTSRILIVWRVVRDPGPPESVPSRRQPGK